MKVPVHQRATDSLSERGWALCLLAAVAVFVVWAPSALESSSQSQWLAIAYASVFVCALVHAMTHRRSQNVSARVRSNDTADAAGRRSSGNRIR